MFATTPLLSLVIWTPILGGVWALFAGEEQKHTAKLLGLVVSLITCALCVPLYIGFNTSTHQMQFVEFAPWITTFNINYHLGIDGISLLLILLTAFTTVLAVLAGWEAIEYRISQYMAAFLILEGLMNGVFASLDSILFYVFWEAMLVPMFLIIGIWGGPHRVYATIKFFLFTFLGSVFLLVAILYLYFQAGSFEILALYDLPIGLTAQKLLFIAFLLAFAVKVPMWPVHTWLPDAHVEAPTGGSVILAAIMLKMGAYGFLRFSLPIVPDGSEAFDWLMISLSLIAIIYIGFVALVQHDMKKLIAYSSIAHMGFVTLGFFIVFRIIDNTGSTEGATRGMEGGLMQMISHGFISGALFLCVGVMYDRLHTREISDYGGVVNTMPHFAAFMMLFAMANAALPGTSGFVGEFLIILSSFEANVWFAVLAAMTLVLGAAYTLWMYKRVIFGDIASEGVAKLKDINFRETFVLGAVAVAVLLFGVWPAPLFEVMGPSIQHLLQHIAQSKVM
ncbi:MAG: NADH-quinone oxidoreductase subunit M [Gammaproteobacteria bacterium]|nr:NADH-quinone oxidoreductase subunit M [Gammaproteobacteria bacterium]MCI0590445.1 NADH-quinone oxidoreductase subunit M [Gammaproteobacteria bacterium]